MIKLPIDKKVLIKFLGPVSRLGDKSVVKFYKNKIYTLMSSEDTNIILYATSTFSGAEINELIRFPMPPSQKIIN